jgi:hypothetical protein
VRTIELIVPGLLQALSDPAAALARFPSLSRWLARARLERSRCEGLEQALCERFGVARQDDWPVAPLTLLADGAAPGTSYWLRADPAHLQATRGDLVLARSGDLGLTQDEADSLADALTRHFSPEGLNVSALCPQRWYMRLEQPPTLTTTPPPHALGRSVDPLLPRGPQALAWHRRLNEMQMLLHDHPVNVQRETRGALTVNSLWLWGGGCLPSCARLSPPLAVWSDDALARGLAQCANATFSAVPADATVWLRDAAPHAHLIVLDDFGLDPALASDGLRRLEERWLTPLLHALAASTVQRAALITHHMCELLRFRLFRLDLWKFWRRPSLPSLGPGATLA